MFQYVPRICMLLVWQNGLMHHWRPFQRFIYASLETFWKVYLPDGVNYLKLCSVISCVLHLSSPLIETSPTFVAWLRASFVERVSLLPKFCIETRLTVLKPALTVWCHKSWPIDGYYESLHFASPAIPAHVPVSQVEIWRWGFWGFEELESAKRSYFKSGIPSAGLLQACSRSTAE